MTDKATDVTKADSDLANRLCWGYSEKSKEEAAQLIARHRKASEQPASGEVMREALERALTDPQRMLWRNDVEGICPTANICFEYGDRVRCGPCAIKQAEACGVVSDMTVPNLPEVYRLRREIAALSTTSEAPEAGRLREALEWYGEQARLAQMVHSEGDAGRRALEQDGGKKARAALSPPCEGAE